VAVLEAIFSTMDASDRSADVGGPVMEALIKVYGQMGSYEEAKRIFDMIEGPSNGPCLRAILFACSTAHPSPRWEEVWVLCMKVTITCHLPHTYIFYRNWFP
jgi:pentatricopeptide repeat protein